MNSLKHGLRAQRPLLPTEDPAAFNEFADDLRAELKPETAVEAAVLERVIDLFQKAHRATQFEVGVLAHHYHQIKAERAAKQASHQTRLESGSAETPEAAEPFALKTEILDPSKYEEAVREREVHEQAQRSEDATMGEAFIRAGEGNALGNLVRYSRPIDRGIRKNLELFFFLQAQRRARLGSAKNPADDRKPANPEVAKKPVERQPSGPMKSENVK